MNGYETYVEYFENLVVQFEGIDHDPAEGSGKKAFFRINLEEVLTGIRQDIDADGLFFVLTNYVFKPIEKGSQNMKQIELLFYVMGTHEESNYDDETRVYKEAEIVVEKFINRIRLDSIKETKDAGSFFYGSQDVMNVEQVVPLRWEMGKNQIGWQVSMTISPFWNNCVLKEDWNDIETDEDAKPY